MYIERVLTRFYMKKSKKKFLHMSHNTYLSKNRSPSTHSEREKISTISYASAIGSLMYVMLCTRVDVSYVLSILVDINLIYVKNIG